MSTGDVKVKTGATGKRQAFDNRLNSEAAVNEFATTHASRPTTYIHQYATHQETTYIDYQGEDGNMQRREETRTIVDLDKWTDITEFLAEDWEWRNEGAVQKYCTSSAALKRLTVTKRVDDLPNVRRSLSSMVGTHYSTYSCSVTTKKEEAKIYIFPNNNASKVMRSGWTVAGFFIGGLIVGGVVFLVVRHIATAKFKADMHYPFAVDEDSIWEEVMDRCLQGTRGEGARERAEEKAKWEAERAEIRAVKEKRKAFMKQAKEKKKQQKKAEKLARKGE